MKRDLKYSIRCGDENELALTHGMSLQGGQVVCDWYDIEGEGRRIRYLPEELAELRAAIDEMLRMAEQHRDALTDGAGEPATLTVGEADLVSVADIKLLGMLSEGVTLKMGHPALSRFRNRGWVDVTPETESRPTSLREYGITDAGRRALAAQTPEAESISQAVLAVLQELADGNRLCFDSIRIVWSLEDGREVNLYGASGLKLGGLVQAIPQTTDYPPSRTYYDISDEGRAALAERDDAP